MPQVTGEKKRLILGGVGLEATGEDSVRFREDRSGDSQGLTLDEMMAAWRAAKSEVE